MYQRNRNIVNRRDGRPVNVARSRGQLFVCHNNCCCGRVEDGIPAVPVDRYHDEWTRRRLRNVVHLTIGGCLGPCALANVVLLMWEGQALWFQGMNEERLVLALYDYIERMLDVDSYLPPLEPLASLQFTASAWQDRPDGLPVEDHRPRRRTPLTDPLAACEVQHAPVLDGSPAEGVDRLVAMMDGASAAPRKNGELVFDAPWQGRIFGMAVAMHEGERIDWEEFRQRLIARIGLADSKGDPSGYYERWTAAFESLLVERGIVRPEELEERTYEFEFGERDDVF
jgi:nitrile hydratase accessory protein